MACNRCIVIDKEYKLAELRATNSKNIKNIKNQRKVALKRYFQYSSTSDNDA